MQSGILSLSDDAPLYQTTLEFERNLTRMEQSDKGTYTAYVPVHSTAADAATPMAQKHAPNSIRLDVAHQKNRGCYYLAATPMRKEGAAESCILSAIQFVNLEPAPRFSAKKLAESAARVGRQLANPSDRDTEVWHLIGKVLRANELALTTPATGKTREPIIDSEETDWTCICGKENSQRIAPDRSRRCHLSLPVTLQGGEQTGVGSRP